MRTNTDRHRATETDMGEWMGDDQMHSVYRYFERKKIIK